MEHLLQRLYGVDAPDRVLCPVMCIYSERDADWI